MLGAGIVAIHAQGWGNGREGWSGKPIVLVHPVDLAATWLSDTWLPVWSPDGRFFVVLSGSNSGDPHIDVMNADGSGRFTVVGAKGGQPQAWLP